MHNNNRSSQFSDSLGISNAPSSKYYGVGTSNLSVSGVDSIDGSECESIVYKDTVNPSQVLEASHCDSILIQKLKLLKSMAPVDGKQEFSSASSPHQPLQQQQQQQKYLKPNNNSNNFLKPLNNYQAAHGTNQEAFITNASYEKLTSIPEVIDANHSIFEASRCIQLKLHKPTQGGSRANALDSIFESEGKHLITIGRTAANDIVLSDQLSSISSQHAMLKYLPEKQSWFIHDKGSRNGTFLAVHNAPIKVQEKIAIGLNLCTITEITLDLAWNAVRLSFVSMVDEAIPEIVVHAKLKGVDKFFIGKAHQKELQSDPMIADNQCYLQFAKDKNQIKIFNCDGTDYPVARQILPTKQNPNSKDMPEGIKLKNGDIIRLGLLSFYGILAFTKPNKQGGNKSTGIGGQQGKVQECGICFQKKKAVCILNPCNHSDFCIECLLDMCYKEKLNCPVCKMQFDDFDLKN